MSAQTVPTRYASVNGVKLAYRRLGKQGGLPLLFLTHLHGTTNLVDPLLFNTIARNREVILFDNAGCGYSEGTIQETLQEAGTTTKDFLSAIGVPRVDVIGFSLGGMIAQVIAVEHPKILDKVVPAGTQSSYTEGIVFSGPKSRRLPARTDGPFKRTTRPL